ncbi:7188_t:CDS:2 [Funneliformis geosporum]|uniref:4381_t:CDS:1 n=1 Tax=Funneliformis geosporum TaxID=1117311 RepID=A0A9W4SFK4_9GLOM|nr:4381_t:CDS:2 [Funneliformis geosporum]CAI2169012.1 7188_t:CDS:2 [Funneliformis geosporum]
MSPTKVLKNLSIELLFNLPPNNNPITLTIVIKKDQLLLDIVRHFMMEKNIPCYLEVSILSTIEALMLASLHKDMEKDVELNENKAYKIRSELVAKYQKHTARYNDAPSEDIFPRAYHTLVHSPVSSIFDTFLQLESNYKQAIKELNIARERDKSLIDDRHKIEVEAFEPGSQADGGKTKVIERQVEEIEFLQATSTSELEAIQRSQKQEYCNFVLILYEAHQRLFSQQAIRLDGREIVSEVINEMKTECKLSKELLSLDYQYTNGSRSAESRSRHGSISSLAEIMLHSPSPIPSTSNVDEKSNVNGNNNEDITKIKDMGFTDEEAKVAFEMGNGNMQEAIMLLLDNKGKVDAQIANGGMINAIPIPRRPSMIGQSQQMSSPPHRRSRSHSKQLQLTIQKQEKKGTWSPITFLQQQKNNMMTSQNNSSLRKLGGFINKAMENFGFEEGNVNGNHMQLEDPRLVESFTISLGNQVKVTHNLRLLVSDMDDLLKSSNDIARDMAYRAQTAASLYSQDLTAIILLLTPKDWPMYKLGKSANKEFFKRCKESTELHFDNVENQLEVIENDYSLDDSNGPSLQEGDFFITRHSNLPLVHVVFHLVIDFESIQKSELTHRSRVISGLRNILRTVNRFDISKISLPFLLLPSHVDVFSDQNLDEKVLYRRGELVLKCTKGFMMENSRLPKHVTAKENDTKTVSFLLPKTANDQQFHEFRLLLTSTFKAS